MSLELFDIDVDDYEDADKLGKARQANQEEFERIATRYAEAFEASGKEPGEEALRGLAEAVLAATKGAKVRETSGVSCTHSDLYGGDPLKTNLAIASFHSDGVDGCVRISRDLISVYQEEYHWGFVNVGPDDCEKDTITDAVLKASFDARCIGSFLESSMARTDTPEAVAKRQKLLEIRAAEGRLRAAAKARDLPAYLSALEARPVKDLASHVVRFAMLTDPSHAIWKPSRVVGAVLKKTPTEWAVLPVIAMHNQVSGDGTRGTRYTASEALSLSGPNPEGVPIEAGVLRFSSASFPDAAFEGFDPATGAFVPDALRLLSLRDHTSLGSGAEALHRGALVIKADWLLERAADFDENAVADEYLYGTDDSEIRDEDMEAACAEALAADVEEGLLHVELVIDGGDSVRAYAVGEGSECCSVPGEDAEVPLTPTESRLIFDRFESELIAAKDAAYEAELDNEPEM